MPLQDQSFLLINMSLVGKLLILTQKRGVCKVSAILRYKVERGRSRPESLLPLGGMNSKLHPQLQTVILKKAKLCPGFLPAPKETEES